MDEDGARFEQWFGPWLEARKQIPPRGQFGEIDLEAAFTAGRSDQHQQTLDEILERTRRLENTLRSAEARQVSLRASDDRPGTPDTPPHAGPVPTQD